MLKCSRCYEKIHITDLLALIPRQLSANDPESLHDRSGECHQIDSGQHQREFFQRLLLVARVIRSLV